MEAELSVAESKAKHRSADQELDAYINREDGKRRRVEGEYDYDRAWRELEEEHQQDRREAIATLWCRFHRRQAIALRRTMESMIDHHEEQAKRWEGS